MMAYQMALHPDALKRDLSSLEGKPRPEAGAL